VFAWLKRKSAKADPEHARALYEAVRQSLGDDDDEHVRIVASIAALLLCVAYADQDYADEEEAFLRQMLSRVNGLDAAGVDAISAVLRAHTVRIAGAEATTYARELLELTDDHFRLELLDALVDLAAADDIITVSETNMLRTVTRSLGLPQQAYNDSQTRHRHKLAVLKGPSSG
jgi:uncharacterized tellurite resistance protein B-like protein